MRINIYFSKFEICDGINLLEKSFVKRHTREVENISLELSEKSFRKKICNLIPEGGGGGGDGEEVTIRMLYIIIYKKLSMVPKSDVTNSFCQILKLSVGSKIRLQPLPPLKISRDKNIYTSSPLAPYTHVHQLGQFTQTTWNGIRNSYILLP